MGGVYCSNISTFELVLTQLTHSRIMDKVKVCFTELSFLSSLKSDTVRIFYSQLAVSCTFEKNSFSF